jgi:hypothetical protein
MVSKCNKGGAFAQQTKRFRSPRVVLESVKMGICTHQAPGLSAIGIPRLERFSIRSSIVICFNPSTVRGGIPRSSVSSGPLSTVASNAEHHTVRTDCKYRLRHRVILIAARTRGARGTSRRGFVAGVNTGSVRQNYDKRQRWLTRDTENKRVRGTTSRSANLYASVRFRPAPPVFSCSCRRSQYLEPFRGFVLVRPR